MATPWERPFVLSEVHQSAGNWSLASDARLLLLMEEFSKGIFTSIQDVGSKIKVLSENSETTHAKLANVCNNFSALSSSQFIENRVDENVSDVKNVPSTETNTAESKAKEEAAVMERCTEALHLGLATLDSQFQRVDIAPLTTTPANSASSNAVSEIPKSTIFVPINPYSSRRLPTLIGSQPFFADDYCGLFDPDAVVATETVSPVPQSSFITSASPPPPPPLPGQASKPVSPPEQGATHSQHSSDDSDDDFRTATGGLHDELLGKGIPSSRIAQTSQDEDDEEGDLFSSHIPASVSQPKRPAPTATPDESQLFTEDSVVKPVAAPEVKPTPKVTIPQLPPGNSLFDEIDDDDGDLFSGGTSKTAKPASTSAESAEPKQPVASNLFFDESESVTSGDNANRPITPEDITANSEQTTKPSDMSEAAMSPKPSRSESVVSQKKLPTGAVSLFGSSAKADPLAEALRSRFNIGSFADRERSSSGASVKNVTPAVVDTASPPHQPLPRVSQTPEKPKAPATPKSPAVVVPATSSLFDDDEDEKADLFATKPAAAPKPVAAPQQPQQPVQSTSSSIKPVSSASLFANDEDDEDDLFGSPQSMQPKKLQTPQAKPQPSSSQPVVPKVPEQPATPKAPEQPAAPKAPEQSAPPALKPSSSTLFDVNDDDDDDLFGAVAKKTKQENAKHVAKEEPADVISAKMSKETPLAAPATDDDEDLFAVKRETISKPTLTASDKVTVKETPSPAAPVSEPLKAVINPLALLPGAQLPKPPKAAAKDIAPLSPEKEENRPTAAPAAAIVRKQQRSGNQVGDVGSLVDFDAAPSEKQTLPSSSSARVTGPRRNRPSRWAGPADPTASSADESPTPASLPEPVTLPAVKQAEEVKVPVKQVLPVKPAEDLFSHGSDHPLVSASMKKETSESVGQSSKKEKPVFSESPVTSPPKIRQVGPSSLFDDDDNGGDLFGKNLPKSPSTVQQTPKVEPAKPASTTTNQSLSLEDEPEEADDIFRSAPAVIKKVVTDAIGVKPVSKPPLPVQPEIKPPIVAVAAIPKPQTPLQAEKKPVKAEVDTDDIFAD